jgi:hypothetical protein
VLSDESSRHSQSFPEWLQTTMGCARCLRFPQATMNLKAVRDCSLNIASPTADSSFNKASVGTTAKRESSAARWQRIMRGIHCRTLFVHKQPSFMKFKELVQLYEQVSHRAFQTSTRTFLGEAKRKVALRKQFYAWLFEREFSSAALLFRSPHPLLALLRFLSSHFLHKIKFSVSQL